MPACGQAVGYGVCDTPELWCGAAGLCARVRACAGAAESVHTYTYRPFIKAQSQGAAAEQPPTRSLLPVWLTLNPAKQVRANNHIHMQSTVRRTNRCCCPLTSRAQGGMYAYRTVTVGNVNSFSRYSINQSKVLTKPHTGKGEATSQHHHRGGNTCITK